MRRPGGGRTQRVGSTARITRQGSVSTPASFDQPERSRAAATRDWTSCSWIAFTRLTSGSAWRNASTANFASRACGSSRPAALASPDTNASHRKRPGPSSGVWSHRRYLGGTSPRVRQTSLRIHGTCVRPKRPGRHTLPLHSTDDSRPRDARLSALRRARAGARKADTRSRVPRAPRSGGRPRPDERAPRWSFLGENHLTAADLGRNLTGLRAPVGLLQDPELVFPR